MKWSWYRILQKSWLRKTDCNTYQYAIWFPSWSSAHLFIKYILYSIKNKLHVNTFLGMTNSLSLLRTFEKIKYGKLSQNKEKVLPLQKVWVNGKKIDSISKFIVVY